MKKLLSIILGITILITCVSGLSFNAMGADIIANGTCGTNGGNMTWALDSDGTITITGAGQRMADYYANSRAGWYSNRDKIKRVVIQDGVINIGSYAFADCSNLKEVQFGTIDTLGNNAFENCTSLKHAYLPDSCSWIWTAAFKGCTSLLSAYVGYCNSYSNAIPDEMFRNCNSLSVLKLGNGINKFNANSMNGCSSLEAIITEADSLSIANNNAFNGVNKSKCYIVSSKSGAQSFASSNGFAYTNERSGICSDNTYSQTRLTWSYDANNDTLSFSGSGDMKAYDNGSQPWHKFIGAIRTVTFKNTDAKASTSTSAFEGARAIESLDLTNIYSVGFTCFKNCDGISGRVEFDSNIAAIWGYAFENNTSLDSITFKAPTDDHDLQIKVGAFIGCSGTTYWLNLPKNTSVIEERAFFGTGFNYTTIDSDKVSIGADAFGNGTGGYARFFGNGGTNSGVYTYVKNNRDNNKYNWWYYCKSDNHTYTSKTIYPTCHDEGYDLYYCMYCDADTSKSNYTTPLGHDHVVLRAENNEFIYRCQRCSKTNIYVPAIDIKKMIGTSISSTAGYTKYMQRNYKGIADVDNDGVINARDYLLVLDAIKSPDVNNKQTVIDLNTEYQTMDGFGASAAWWSQYVGTWENADDIIKLLYDENEGIGLDIYRYNLGAGSRDINDNTMYIDDERTNCFLQKDGTYNWNNDAGAMRALSLARAHNPNLKVTLFSNSAPVYMTNNGHAYANPVNDDGTFNANISEGNYQRFASFVSTCAEHFIDEGYNVTEVSPINEPEWSWAGWYNGDGNVSMNQEGCNWTDDEALKFYNNYMIPTLRSNAKLNGRVKVSVWESGQMNHWQYWNGFLNKCFSNANDYKNNNANIRSYVDSVDTHSYWASTNDRNAVANQLKSGSFGQKVRCTEYCQMGTDGSSGVYGRIYANGMTNGQEIEYALAMADIIHQDLTILNAVEWDWWTACGKGIYTDSLVYVNANNHNDIQTAKRLYALGNYSKFIDEGAKRVSISTGARFGASIHTDETYSWTDDWGTYTDKNNYIEQSAYKNPDGTVVAVYINNSDTNETTTFDSNTFGSYKTYVTDQTRDLALNQNGQAGKDAVVIPAKSVTTVVLNTK